MERLVIEISSINELASAAKHLIRLSSNQKIFCFNAPMGAGKTTLIKHLCNQLNYDGIVSSPTFPIINSYQGNQTIFHIDCYRLKNADEAIQVGMEDCIHSGNYCFIEWADIVKEILPEKYVAIAIEIIDESKRRIVAQICLSN
ncbi:MAG: tRNA ((37)-N6)-threonylcarbamoyltransferase complex ATPase subunit type 1 TsaE [Bacteroidota bacterium]